MQTGVGGQGFHARLAFLNQVLSPSLSWRPSSCLTSPHLCFSLPLVMPPPPTPDLSGPLSHPAIFPSIPCPLPRVWLSLCLSLPRKWKSSVVCGQWGRGSPGLSGRTQQLLSAPVRSPLLQFPLPPSLPVTGEWGLKCEDLPTNSATAQRQPL